MGNPHLFTSFTSFSHTKMLILKHNKNEFTSEDLIQIERVSF